MNKQYVNGVSCLSIKCYNILTLWTQEFSTRRRWSFLEMAGMIESKYFNRLMSKLKCANIIPSFPVNFLFTKSWIILDPSWLNVYKKQWISQEKWKRVLYLSTNFHLKLSEQREVCSSSPKSGLFEFGVTKTGEWYWRIFISEHVALQLIALKGLLHGIEIFTFINVFWARSACWEIIALP